MDDELKGVAIPNIPKLGWLASMFRSRFLLQYWLNNQLHQVWVSGFREKSESCIIYQDYATKKTSIIKSDRPITYTLTSDK